MLRMMMPTPDARTASLWGWWGRHSHVRQLTENRADGGERRGGGGVRKQRKNGIVPMPRPGIQSRVPGSCPEDTQRL